MQLFTITRQCCKRIIPNKRDTHSNTYTVLLQQTRRLPQTFTQNPMKRKRESRLPLARRPSVTAPWVPPAWFPSSCLAPARVAGPCRSGFGPSPLQPRDSSETLSTTPKNSPYNPTLSLNNPTPSLYNPTPSLWPATFSVPFPHATLSVHNSTHPLQSSLSAV